jgi:hypothetical protein
VVRVCENFKPKNKGRKKEGEEKGGIEEPLLLDTGGSRLQSHLLGKLRSGRLRFEASLGT